MALTLHLQIEKMDTSIDKDYAPGLSETVAAAVVATDDKRFGHLLAMTLRGVGVAVKETNAGEDIQAAGSDCRLFVIDGDLSSGDAIGLIRTLRSQESTCDSALVILAPRDEVDAYDAGVDMALPKPISMPLFMARIRSVMRRYRIIL